MRVGISIDEVFRDTLLKLIEVFDKYEVGDFNFDDVSEIKTKKYKDYFIVNPENKVCDNLNDMLYNKCSYEIFGASNFMEKDMFEPINEFLYDFCCDQNNKVTIFSKEFSRSIPSTLYFLSKTSINIRDYKFYEYYNNVWEDYDVIITAEPEIIESAPKNKVVIKIEAPYNVDVESKYSYTSIVDLFSNNELNKILKNV